MSDLKQKSIELEHYETPRWVVDGILRKELLTHNVIDPCAGTGVMADGALDAGYNTLAIDIYDWGYPCHLQDFLLTPARPFKGEDFTVFMNPPFSKTVEFVEKSFELGARKIVMFQRMAFRESIRRREFFEKHPLARVYLCGNRAHCWRHDLPINDKGRRYNPETGKEYGGTPTAYGFFVWERGQEQSNPPSFMLYKNPLK